MRKRRVRLKIQGIARTKLGTDGHGVTDLVAMAGCPLSCEHCLNKKLLAEAPVRDVSAADLLTDVMEEACYFVATGGGVAFGGGEPLLQWEEIVEFAGIMPDWMQLTIETSLQAPRRAIETLLPVTDLWFVDIKSLDPSIYARYTHGSLDVALSNLQLLLPVADKVKVRVPSIPGYKGRDVAEAEGNEVRRMGFSDVEVFDYVVRND